MITHNVYIWLKPTCQSEQDQALLKEGVTILVGNDLIQYSMVGISAQTPSREVTDKSFDCGISLKFLSVEDHNVFQKSSEHDEFVGLCGHMFEKVVVYDLEKN